MEHRRSRRARRFHLTYGFPACSVIAAVLLAHPAFARKNGIAATSCSGCHGAATRSEISATASPVTFNPGDEVAIVVTVARQGAKSAGIYVAEPGIGQLRALDQELKLDPTGLVHSAPKSATDGKVEFRFAWKAPSSPGAVRFEVAALAADGNGQSSGDASTSDLFSFVYGCKAATFYYDLDGDGYGSEVLKPTLDCEGHTPAGYSSRRDDCDDTSEGSFPGAKEVCNGRDDNCDGTVDEGAPAVELWPDPDGDGYYGTRVGTPVMGCVPYDGYAANPGDCASADPKRNPGVMETCNFIDDNCDGTVDERVRPQCGVGSCRRDSPTCEAEDCVPGEPTPETCNFLDDDCNGFVDDGTPCPSGERCVSGKCVSGGTPSGGSTSGGGTSGGSATVPTGGTHMGVGVAGTPSGGSDEPSAGGRPGAAGAIASGGLSPGTGGSGTEASSPASSGCSTPRLGRNSALGSAAASLAVIAAWLRRRRPVGARWSRGTRSGAHPMD